MITLNNLTLRRGPRKLLENINFRIETGQRVGIVGRNGTGKSSLFALMRGELTADAGEISIPPHLDITSVRQHTPAGPQAAIDFVLDGDIELRDLQADITQAEVDADGHKL